VFCRELSRRSKAPGIEFVMATTSAMAARQTFREIHGIVVSAGLMQKTVKVRVGGQRWNKQVKKVGSLSNGTYCAALKPARGIQQPGSRLD
jgi:hypothetical protein